MGRRPIGNRDIETQRIGEYLETLGKGIQDGEVIVEGVYEDRDMADLSDDLTIKFGIKFTPCEGVVLESGVPYDDGLPRDE